MAVGDVTSKHLFDYEFTAADAQISAGPGSGKKWIFSVTICNKSSSTRTVRLYRRFSGPTDRYVLYDTQIEANKSIMFGPFVLNNGETLRGQASAATSVDIVADGYEEEV